MLGGLNTRTTLFDPHVGHAILCSLIWAEYSANVT